MRDDVKADAGQPEAGPDIRPAGDRALLVDVGTLTAAMTWHSALTSTPLAGQIEAIAAARTVLVRFDSPTAAEAAVPTLSSFTPEAAGSQSPREHVLDVVYDGEDLAKTAGLLGLSSEGLVAAHTSTVWQAAFGGFAPGFAYCVPADGGPAWDVPRLEEPRTAVPPGSVGLAGMFSAVYPRRSPGGWRLIGRTDAQLWRPDEEPPALMSPGDRVRYRAVRDTARTADESASSRAAEVPADDRVAEETATGHAAGEPDGEPIHASRTVLRVDDPGLLTLIEDAGRPGRGDLGVSPSGFADRASARAANITVGNPPEAPLLEVMGTVRLTCLSDVVIAVAGAAGQETVTARLLRAGDVAALEPAIDLARTYVAIRGGVAVTAEVGSASADVLSGLGPGPLLAGAEVAVPARGPSSSVGHGVDNPARARRCGSGTGTESKGTGAGAESSGSSAGAGPSGSSAGADSSGTGLRGEVVVRVVLGPRDDWFSHEEVARFASIPWSVDAQSNRVGMRLLPAEGHAPLVRDRVGELASEGTVTGTVQVPASGCPVVFGPDRPVTGGYPAIATVVDGDLDVLAQVPHGARVRFRVIDR